MPLGTLSFLHPNSSPLKKKNLWTLYSMQSHGGAIANVNTSIPWLLLFLDFPQTEGPLLGAKRYVSFRRHRRQLLKKGSFPQVAVIQHLYACVRVKGRGKEIRLNMCFVKNECHFCFARLACSKYEINGVTCTKLLPARWFPLRFSYWTTLHTWSLGGISANSFQRLLPDIPQKALNNSLPRLSHPAAKIIFHLSNISCVDFNTT